jgi:tetratricopeptide (TPR) repeat protein
VDGGGESGLVVVGESGSGKSAFLANLVLRRQATHPDEVVIYHAVGANASSAEGAGIVARLLRELDRRLSLGLTIPDDRNQLQFAFASALPLIDRNVVLVLDGLDQLEHHDPYRDLRWIPDTLPVNVRLVASTLPGREGAALHSRAWPAMAIAPLTRDERRAVIVAALAASGKSFGESTTSRLADAPPSANPLFLRSVIEELRVFGSHERLEERLAFYFAPRESDGTPPTPEDLFGRILARHEEDYERDRPGLVRDAMSLLWAARRGLTESELLALLGSGEEDPLPFAHWAPLYYAAEHALIDRGGRLGFFFVAIRDAVRQRYLATEADERAAHARLAEFFETQNLLVRVTITGADLPPELAAFATGSDARLTNPRQVEEIPWQLARAGEWARLAFKLADLDFFEEVWKASRTDAEAYWAQLYEEAPWPATEVYRDVVEDPVRHEKHVESVMMMLGFLGEGEAVREMGKRLVKHYRAAGDKRGLARSLHDLAARLRFAGEVERAMELLEEEEQLRQRAGDDTMLAACLNAQALLLRRRGNLEGALALNRKAERIAREIGDPQLLSPVLLNQAQIRRNQNSPDEEILRLLREGERYARQVGDPWVLARALYFLALTIFKPFHAQGGVFHAVRENLPYSGDSERFVGTFYPLVEEAYGLARDGYMMDFRADLEPIYEGARKDMLQWGRVLTDRGVTEFEEGRLDEAFASFTRAESVFRRVGDDEGIGICLGEKGLVFMRRGDFDRAFELLREEEVICRRLSDLSGLHYCLCNQALVFIERSEFDTAEAVLRKVAEECSSVEDAAGKQRRLDLAAELQRRRGASRG